MEKPYEELECTSCGKMKQVGEFYSHKNNNYRQGRSYACRACVLKKARIANKKNPKPKKNKVDAEDFWDINGDGIFM